VLRLNCSAIKMNTTLTTLYPNTTTAANTTHAICRTMVPTYTISLTLLSCFLSIFGSFIIIITYINLPVIQNFARKLLLSLTVADLLTAFGNSIGSIRYLVLKSKGGDCELLLASDSVCVVQSFITTYSSMASFFWTSIIAFHIYMQIIHRSSGMRTGLMLIGYQVLCWGVPGK
jgi:G protein-coupled receptor 157